jgi:hypothetical protein
MTDVNGDYDYRDEAVRNRARGASFLLPDPGGEVVLDLLAVIDDLLECEDCGHPVRVPDICGDCAIALAESAPEDDR